MKYQPIWMDDRRQIVENFKNKNPTIAEFDHFLAYYNNLSIESSTIPSSKEIGFATIDFQPVIDYIRSECGQWINAYGSALADILSGEITEMDTKLTKIATDMKREMKERSDLEFVLQTIKNARDGSVNVERSRKTIKQRMYTLKSYKLATPEGSDQLVSSFHQRWKDIITEADKLNVSLTTSVL